MQSESTQLDLDFHAPVGDGYASWQWDREQTIKKIAEVWGLPLNRRVRVRLVNIDSEFEGRLGLAELPVSMDRRRPLLLKLAPITFSSTEIECCTVLEK
jgi:hypothetical protein